MQVDLRNKIAIVTGAAQGIGRAIAQALSRNGAVVVVSDVQEEKGRAAAAALEQATFVPCDVAEPAEVRGLIDAVVRQHGRLDILINNAGINTGRPEQRVTIERYPDEIWHRILDVDLNGVFYCCKAAAGHMIEQGSGNIVNIASIAGVAALRLQIGYVAAKAAVIKMTEAMACELGPHGIRVNAVSPGSTLVEGTRQLFYNDKEMAERITSFIPQKRPGDADEIAAAVLYLVSDAASYVNGHNLIVDGGWTCGFTRDF